MAREDISDHACGVSAAGLAEYLGISTAAVSYALNGKSGVSDHTRKRVLDAAKKFGLEIPARAEMGARTKPLLGLILADLRNPFYQKLGVAVSQEARNAGFDSYLSHTEDDPHQLLSTVKAMADHHVDGIILTATQDGDASIARELRKYGIPYVQVSRKIPTVQAPFVGIDNSTAAYELAVYVADKGYTNVALALGPRRSSASNERLSGYLLGLLENGISVPQEWIIRIPLGVEGGLQAARYFRGLSRGLPEVIICGTDAIAYGIYSDFSLSGISIPRDVALTGFDGVMDPFEKELELTTIVQPITQMAGAAVSYLGDLVRNVRVAPHEVICRYEMRIGNSC